MEKSQLNLMLTTSGLGVMGSEVLIYILSLYILNSSHSAIYFSISLVASPLISLIFLPFVGPVIDRFNKKKVIFFSQLFCILTILVITSVTIIFQTRLTLVVIFLLNAILTVTDDFTGNTMFAATISMVREDELAKFRGYDQTIKSLIGLMAPMIGAFLFMNLPIYEIILIEVIFEIGALIGYMSLDFKMYLPKILSEKSASLLEENRLGLFFKDFKTGLSYINKNLLLKSFIIFFAMINGLLCVVNVGLPFVQLRALNFSNTEFSIVQTAFVAGSIVAGIIFATKKLSRPLKFIMIGNIGIGLLLILFGILPILFSHKIVLWVAMASANAILGFVLAGINIPYSVWLSETVPVTMQGRVFSFISVTSQVMQPIGLITFGFLYSIKTSYPRIQNFLILLGCGLSIVLFSFSYLQRKRSKL